MTLIQRRRLIAQKKTWSCTARWSREADWGITWRDSRQNQLGLANCGISFWLLQLTALNSLSKVVSSMNHRKITLLRVGAIWMRVEFSYFWKFWSRILSGQGTLRLGPVSRPGTGMFRLCFTIQCKNGLIWDLIQLCVCFKCNEVFYINQSIQVVEDLGNNVFELQRRWRDKRDGGKSLCPEKGTEGWGPSLLDCGKRFRRLHFRLRKC